MPTTNNRHIAKNTLYLYFRMLLIMGVNLYASRVVLAELGVDDYGVYIVVGGVVSMLTFLNSCMSTSTQRYINYELGNPNGTIKSLKEVFSTATSIHIAIAVVVIFLSETIGLWFVNNKLIIPASSIGQANIVYQTSIAVFCVSILQVPFNAAIIAHEKMEIYAIVSIIEALLKLSVAFLLISITSYKLAFYGILLLVVQIIIAGVYITICIHRFKECSLRCVYIPKLFREMFAFAGWNMFGSIAWLVRGQGIGIILNIFFGPILNAAKGVADQVSHAVTNLTSNFQMALNPQITKNYASGAIKAMELLTYRGIKFSCCLLWLIILPIALNINDILDIWLEAVPEYTAVFVILILADSLVGNLFGSPLMTSLAATGKIRTYQVIVSLALLGVLPCSYFALKSGWSPQSIFYLNIAFNFIAGILRLWFCRRQIDYSIRFYLRYAFFPILAVIVLSIPLPILIDSYIRQLIDIKLLTIFISGLATIALTGPIIWIAGFTKDERYTIFSMVKTKIKSRSI